MRNGLPEGIENPGQVWYNVIQRSGYCRRQFGHQLIEAKGFRKRSRRGFLYGKFPQMQPLGVS